MAPPLVFTCRAFLPAAVLLALWTAPTEIGAQEAAPLPDYVIEEFGAPPPIPEGPLSEELQRAVEVVFIETLEQGAWTSDQQDALDLIVQSGDPRLAWPISDMMRFTFRFAFDRSLAEAASDLLGSSTRPRSRKTRSSIT
jgi:hypothetical protein